MNKLQKIGVFTLCAVSLLSVGVGALTHSNNYDRVKVSANNTNENYYLNDYVYTQDLDTLDVLSYVNDVLISQYHYDSGYKLRYICLLTDEGYNNLEMRFENYIPFNISYIGLENDDQIYMEFENIYGGTEIHRFSTNDYLTTLEILYIDNCLYDGLFNINNTTSMYDIDIGDYLLYECAPIYDTNDGENHHLEMKYLYNDTRYNFIDISNMYVYIGGITSSNYEYAPNGRYYVKFSDFDLETDDFNTLNNILPLEIEIQWILQNEYNMLQRFNNYKDVYLSAWTLSQFTWGNGVLNEGDLKNEQTLTFNNHYYLDGVYYDRLELVVVKTNIGIFFKNVTLKNVTSYVEKTILAYGFNGETYTIEARYTGKITLVDNYMSYYKEMLSVFGLYAINGSSIIGGTTGNNDFFDTFGSAFNGVANILNIELLPNLSLWILLLIPFFVTLLLFVIKLFKR